MMRYDKLQYKSVFKVPPTEWCSVMARRAKSNALVKAFLDVVKDRLPKKLLSCPVNGRIEANNILLRNKMLSIFPTGMYKFSATAYDDIDDNIMSLSLEVKAES